MAAYKAMPDNQAAAHYGQPTAPPPPPGFAPAEAREQMDRAWSGTKRAHVCCDVMCFIGGAALLAFGILNLFDVITIPSHPDEYILNIYMILIACVIFIWEFPKQYEWIKRLRLWFHYWMRFTTRLTGRGIFYFIHGLLIMFTWDALNHRCVRTSNGGHSGSVSGDTATFSFNVSITITFALGAYVAFCGLLCIILGCTASRRFGRVKQRLRDTGVGTSENEIRAAFQRFDLNGDGHIDASELGALCSSLSLHIDEVELQRALEMLDADRNGTVEFDEFMVWFTGKDRRDIV
eukprot:TRINITY_DN51745_c0_g1_i1.p1 TRINITY_DN51745_c0_g1~~TRINITY_DN51745_c0_g1_i1.p1  ORF type:complete len:314 (+),score=114.06 TRINITY_DN51745_c0_g1_i1:69-944(+)